MHALSRGLGLASDWLLACSSLPAPIAVIKRHSTEATHHIHDRPHFEACTRNVMMLQALLFLFMLFPDLCNGLFYSETLLVVVLCCFFFDPPVNRRVTFGGQLRSVDDPIPLISSCPKSADGTCFRRCLPYLLLKKFCSSHSVFVRLRPIQVMHTRQPTRRTQLHSLG